MDNRLDSLSKYFQEKERKKLNNLVKNSGNGLPTMTLDEIKLCCVENNGYETPELNDKLYLHFRGYKKIENLDAYIGCKALWLDSNGLTAIENLSTMLELRCLYLGKNLISKIEGLESLTCLHTIDLSYNRISCVENLSCCPSLKSIVLARNNLTSADSIRHLVACSALECVDVTNNMLQGDDVMDVFASMSALRTLSVNGNEVTKLPAFRKRAIAAMPKVGYLDRPIDELERKAAEAFVTGGAEAETSARQEWRISQQQKKLNESLKFRAWKVEQAEIRRKEAAEGRVLYPVLTAAETRERAEAAERDWEEEQRALHAPMLPFTEFDDAADGDAVVEGSDVSIQVHDVEVELQVDQPSGPDIATPGVADVITHFAVANDSMDGVELSVESPRVVSESLKAGETAQLSDLVRQAKEAEVAEQRERDLLVQESLAMYRRQREVAKSKLLETVTATEKTPVPSTWDAALALPDPSPTPFRAVLSWTLQMDLKLSVLVKECAFDFDRVFLKMISAASDGELVVPRAAIALISSEACRLRWCALDAGQWSELAPGTTSSDVVYKICIDPEEVSDGHGGQLSFDKLSTKVSGSMPRYLVPPKQLPSVRNEDDEDSDSSDADDSEEEEDIAHMRTVAARIKNRQE